MANFWLTNFEQRKLKNLRTNHNECYIIRKHLISHYFSVLQSVTTAISLCSSIPQLLTINFSKV